MTGAAGFIGSHLSERLLSSGYQVWGIDNLDSFYDPEIKKRNLVLLERNSSFRFFLGDIRDKIFLEKIFSENVFLKVIHLAAKAGVRPSVQNPLEYEEVNIRGTMNLLEILKRRKTGQFIFASSSSVYGANNKVPFSETDPVDHPVSPYAATKRAGELFCFNYSHLYGIPVTCLRFFTVYGPRQRPEMAISAFVRSIWEERPVLVYGDGTIQRDFTFIEDIVEGVIRGSEKIFPFEIFNLGGSETHSIKKVIGLLSSNLGKKAIVQYLPGQPGDMAITSADIKKAKEGLGYSPKITLEQGLEIVCKEIKNGKH